MALKIRKQAPAAVAIPQATHVQFFIDIDDAPKLKLSNGSVIAAAASGNPVPLLEQGAAPLFIPNTVQLYSKEVTGISELFAVDDAGNEVQVTSGGGLNLPPPTPVFEFNNAFTTNNAIPNTLVIYTPANNSRSVVIWGVIQAREQTASPAQIKVWVFSGVGDRDGGGIVTAHLLDVSNGPQETQPLDSATWAITFGDTGTQLFINVTGEALKNIDWRSFGWIKESVF